MSQGFSRLPSIDGDETRYYSRASLDLTGTSSYDDFRRRADAASTASLIDRSDSNKETKTKSEDNSAPLRESVRQYSTLVWWMLAMSTAILYGGYDSVILGTLNAVPAYQRDFGDWMQDPKENMKWEWTIPAIWLSLWDGIGPLGQIAGAALGGWLLDRIGRRFCLLLGSIIGALAILTLFLSNMPADKEWKRIMILIGKVVQGLGLGIVKIETFTYMSEVIPVSLKGAVMSLVPTFTLLGQLIGAIVIFTVSSDDRSLSYMIALGSQWALALPPFLLAFFMPESPAYLLKNKNTHSALTSFTRLLGPKNNPRSALHKMETTMEEEAKNSAKVSYMDCFNTANRRRTFIIIFASCIEFFFGLSLLSSVSYFLQQLGMDASKSILFLIAGIVIGLIANACSAWTVSHIGRRKLTVTTLLITAGLWTVMGFAGIKQLSFTPWLAGGLCTAIVVTCGLGCWPASYAIMGETSSLRLRSKSQAIGSLAQNISGIAMNFMLPYLYNPDAANLGAKTGFLFTALSAIGAVMTYFFVPELKGRSALEIDHLFEKGIKSRGSSNWRNMYEELPLGDA
ncbi:MFS general substrate transporter [Zopfia rhizophila CBS 207.26]|uniref:MFS general substrate transporter n=1 Tax=Zopfia rhizophila CBS 207.26 TaxID=1314779 RepID=A0A6A6ECH8_9PEZI|nr:MFS general substrate transporter [Zopfia rhizophila CBS 207.26]